MLYRDLAAFAPRVLGLEVCAIPRLFKSVLGIQLSFHACKAITLQQSPSSPQLLINCFLSFSSPSISFAPRGRPTKSRVLTLFTTVTSQVLSGKRPQASEPGKAQNPDVPKLTWAWSPCSSPGVPPDCCPVGRKCSRRERIVS